MQKYPRVNYSGPYFQPVYTDTIPSGDPYAVRENMNPVVNNTPGSILGFKYFNFDKLNGKNGIRQPPLENIGRLSGKHPLYLTFDSPVPSESLCTILYLQFKD